VPQVGEGQLVNALRDPKLLTRTAHRLGKWIDAL
jgi:hypothetical protein